MGVNKNSRVLDPCCGSGAFLVRAMTDAMDDCDTDEERRQVREHQIYGIEYEEGAFGLSSTNMLIHGDGNSNVVKDSMFDRAAWIQSKSIDVVLMNPPYNGTKNQCDPKYVRQWSDNTKTDPSKGFHYVEWVARQIASAKDENGHVRPSHCRMAVLLPMQCAIGNSTAVRDFKQQMLDHYTLDAVFSLPADVFYPGAAVSACCMVFDLSRKHEKPTGVRSLAISRMTVSSNGKASAGSRRLMRTATATGSISNVNGSPYTVNVRPNLAYRSLIR